MSHPFKKTVMKPFSNFSLTFSFTVAKKCPPDEINDPNESQSDVPSKKQLCVWGQIFYPELWKLDRVGRKLIMAISKSQTNSSTDAQTRPFPTFLGLFESFYCEHSVYMRVIENRNEILIFGFGPLGLLRVLDLEDEPTRPPTSTLKSQSKIPSISSASSH